MGCGDEDYSRHSPALSGHDGDLAYGRPSCEGGVLVTSVNSPQIAIGLKKEQQPIRRQKGTLYPLRARNVFSEVHTRLSSECHK